MAAFLPFVYLTGNACVAAYFFRLAILKFAGGKGPSHAKYMSSHSFNSQRCSQQTNMYLYGLENRENCLSLKLSLDPAFYCDENDMVQFHFA